MKQRFDKLADRVGAMTNWKLGLWVLLILLAVNVVMAFLVFKLTGRPVTEGSESTNSLGWFMITILVPIVETLVFQYLLLHFSLPYLPCWLAVILSGLIFGFSHQYNSIYIIVTTVIGWILAFVFYAKWNRNKEPFTAILLVSAIHIAHNSIVFLGRSF